MLDPEMQWGWNHSPSPGGSWSSGSLRPWVSRDLQPSMMGAVLTVLWPSRERSAPRSTLAEAWKACSGGQRCPGGGRGSARKVSGGTEAQRCPFGFCFAGSATSSCHLPRLPAAAAAPSLIIWPTALDLSPLIGYSLEQPIVMVLVISCSSRGARVGLGTRRHRMVTARNETPTAPAFWLLGAPAPSLQGGCPLWAVVGESSPCIKPISVLGTWQIFFHFKPRTDRCGRHHGYGLFQCRSN